MRDWVAVARSVIEWVMENGRLPRQDGDIDPVELKHGRWLKRQRALQNGRIEVGRVQIERLEWLDRHLPGWNTVNTRPSARKMVTKRSVEGTVKAIQRFVAKHGRLPRVNGPENNETALARFLDNQRQAKRRGIQRRTTLSYLNNLVPGWDAPPPPPCASMRRVKSALLLA